MTDLEAIQAIEKLPKWWTVELNRWSSGWGAKIQAWKKHPGQSYDEKDWYTTTVSEPTLGAAVDRMLEKLKCQLCKSPRALKRRETVDQVLRLCDSCAGLTGTELEAKLFCRKARGRS